VPAGGLTAQFLQKTSNVSYATDWVTLPSYLPLAGGTMNVNAAIDFEDTTVGTVSEVGGYGMAVSSASNVNLLSNVLYDRVFVKNATSTTTLKPTGVEFPDATLQTTAGLSPATAASTYQTLAGMSSYLTTSAAASTYAVTARGLPASGTVGQVLTKQSGTAYDSAWATLIPGDRYLTTSTTSNTIGNGTKSFTIGTGLSYTPTQSITVAFDASNHMHGEVLTYNSGTGALSVDINHHTGSGTYSAWTVNVAGVVPAASIVWGDITGTLGNQTDLANALNSKLELSGGVLDANSTITASTATVNSLFAGDAFGVELTANPSQNASLQYDGVHVQNIAGTMLVTASGLTFPDATTQSTAGLSPATAASTYYLQTNPSGFITSASLSGYAQLSGATFTGEVSTPASTTSSAGLSILPGTAPTSPVNGEIWNTGSDLQVRIGGVTETLAEQSWVSTTYAPKASPALTGNVTITTNSASAALVITQDGTGDVVQFKDVAADTTYTFISADGKLNSIPSVTTGAGFNIPNGVAPTSNLVNGDFWTTTSGVFTRINGNSVQLADTASGLTYSGNNTFTGPTLVFGNTTAASTINIGTGATLTATTKAINIGTNGVSGSTTNITLGSATSGATNLITVNGPMTVANNFTATGLNINIGNQTATAFYNFGTGALVSGQTRTIGIGTNALAGSTNAITIGSAAGTSTTTMQGTTTFAGPITGVINNISLGSGTGAQVMDFATGVTATGLTKAVSIGTNGAAGSTTTIAIGGTAGTSTTTLNGTTNGITAAADTNSVALATTAYVVGQAGSATPIVDGTAAVGTSLRYARQDHVHPTDTSRAALASPTFTGTPAAPTAAVDTNTTQLATTAYVVGQGYAKLASPTFTGTPTLPTGTIATTQTAGDNTTKVATTAFVTAAVPALSATTDVNAPTSTTKATSPKNVVDMLLHAGYNLFYQGAGSSSTSGAGSAIYGYGGRWKEYVSPNAGTAGYALGVYDTEQVSYGYTAYSRSAAISLHDWTKKIWISGRCMLGHPTISTTYDGDANTFARISLGGYTAFAAGDMSSAQRGVGFKVAGGGSAALQLVVTNGTTVTTVTSSFTPTLRQVFDWKIYSDGAGNVTLYVNDSQVATTTAGPSTTGSFGLYMEGVDTTVSSTKALIMENFGTKIYHGV
jgi:hypothetical protein